MRKFMVLAAVCGVAVSAVAFGWGGGAASAHPGAAPEDKLGERIEAAIKKDGPFLTAAERAVIERKCGYPAGSFYGFEISITNGVLTCRDGRKVDDAEMRALLAVAEPRIERRVRSVMESPEVQGAIQAVAATAQREALASIDHAKIARETAEAVRKGLAEAEAEMRRRR
ncbi:MAG TPA: hypothetical protein VIA98_01235 [Allosphingosinicella sp.]|jgi:hypothetical protein